MWLPWAAVQGQRLLQARVLAHRWCDLLAEACFHSLLTLLPLLAGLPILQEGQGL